LRKQAQQARQQGQYGVEAASLEALKALGLQDTSAFDWAEEYLPIAQNNREMLGPYGAVQQLVEAGKVDQARDLLQTLWQKAPYFRDPAHLAPTLGLTLPPKYEADKQRKRFVEACALLRREIFWVPPSSLDEVKEYDGAYNGAMSVENARAALRSQDYDLDQPEAIALLERMIEYQNRAANLMVDLQRVKKKPSKAWLKGIAITMLIISVCGTSELWLSAAAATFDNPYGITVQPPTSIFAFILVGVLALLLLTARGTLDTMRFKHIVRRVNLALSLANTPYQHWRHLAEYVFQQRINAIERE
jgi:hypothetical protein